MIGYFLKRMNVYWYKHLDISCKTYPLPRICGMVHESEYESEALGCIFTQLAFNCQLHEVVAKLLMEAIIVYIPYHSAICGLCDCGFSLLNLGYQVQVDVGWYKEIALVCQKPGHSLVLILANNQLP